MTPAHYLIDTSAAVRLLGPEGKHHEWDRAIEAGLVAMSDITELEIGFSARSSADRAAVLATLHQCYAWAPVPEGTYERARTVQRLLTERGWHRGAGPVDLLVASIAELSGLTLLHCDRDFECIAAVTGQATLILTD
ncbi:PIN domain-containing protein [Streptomyces alkaliphilus]|uniref:Ribonuclease VapC n=1 Tax=Streptomyces alkaliphilus TaxID=1472722 RepID=A0A7W3TB14_9ACTN|nr:PIN domain nuclease [Streptomyces alkaliphilus]MBB0243559.1 PIN domain-containing protein [Streptomyces alkaliphilus]